MRFQILGANYSEGATLGLFQASDYNASKVGTLLYPACAVAVAATASCPTASKQSINLKTGTVYPYVRQGTFDPASYVSGTLPFSGIHQYQTHLFNTPGVQYNPRIVRPCP